MRFYLAHNQLRKIVLASLRGLSEIEVSLDLGKTNSMIKLEGKLAIFPDGSKYDINTLLELSRDLKNIFFLENGEISKIAFFDENMGKYYKLIYRGEKDLPDYEIAGVRQYPVKMPIREYVSLIIDLLKNEVSEKQGIFLFSKLGYLPIEFGKFSRIQVVENDTGVLKLMKLNPWSEEVFNYTIIEEDPYMYIRYLKDSSLDFIFHNPPGFNLSTRKYYSLPLYREVKRTLRRDGLFIHYVWSDSKKLPQNRLAKNVMEKLERLRFKDIQYIKELKLILARK